MVQLKKCCRSTALNVALAAHACLFLVVRALSMEHSNTAQLVYKGVIFSYIENFLNDALREFIGQNMYVLCVVVA